MGNLKYVLAILFIIVVALLFRDLIFHLAGAEVISGKEDRTVTEGRLNISIQEEKDIVNRLKRLGYLS